jgi:hypothetical protein
VALQEGIGYRLEAIGLREGQEESREDRATGRRK